MINSKTSDEAGGSLPVQEDLEPESLGAIAKLRDELESGIKSLELAARDLRIAASTDPKLRHALERAEELTRVENILRRLLDLALDTPNILARPVVAARSLGGAAIDLLPGRKPTIPEQKNNSPL